MSAITKLSSLSYRFAIRFIWIREIVDNSHAPPNLHTKHMGPKEVRDRIISEIASGLKYCVHAAYTALHRLFLVRIHFRCL